MAKELQISIDSSHHAKADIDGLGVEHGESYCLLIVADGIACRSAFFYGNEQSQAKMLKRATDAIKGAIVETEK